MALTSDFVWINPEQKIARGFLMKSSPSLIREFSFVQNSPKFRIKKPNFLRRIIRKIKKGRRIFYRGKYNVQASVSISNSLCGYLEYSREIFKRRQIQDTLYLNQIFNFNHKLSESQFTICSLDDSTNSL